MFRYSIGSETNREAIFFTLLTVNMNHACIVNRIITIMCSQCRNKWPCYIEISVDQD